MNFPNWVEFNTKLLADYYNVPKEILAAETEGGRPPETEAPGDGGSEKPEGADEEGLRVQHSEGGKGTPEEA